MDNKQIQIKFHGLLLNVYYGVLPEETRNHGHPDNRLPDEELDICVTNASIEDFSPDWLEQLVKEELTKQ